MYCTGTVPIHRAGIGGWQLLAGAGAELFGPAPAIQIHIKCYKNPSIFHTINLKFSLKIQISF
jgi:hypothetical protein